MTNDAVQFSDVKKRFGKVDALAGLTLAHIVYGLPITT